MKKQETLVREAENFDRGYTRLKLFIFDKKRYTDIANMHGVTIPAVSGTIDRTLRVLRLHMVQRMSLLEQVHVANLIGLEITPQLRTRLYEEICLDSLLKDKHRKFEQSLDFLVQSYLNLRINAATKQVGEDYLNKKERIYSPDVIEQIAGDLKRFAYIDSTAVLTAISL